MEKIADKKANALQSTDQKTMKQMVQAMMPQIEKALPSVITPERFTRMVTTAISTTPQLAQCTPASFIGSMMQAAQLGVEPNTPLGQAYLLPYRNKGELQCQFQLGYKGLIDLAYRSGMVSLIQAHVVYEKDTFEYELGLEPKLRHIPAMSDRGDPIAVYALWQSKDGAHGYEVMSMDDCRNHAKKYSKAYSSGFSPWATNFEEMCKKTVLKKALKYAPLRSDFVRAVASDETIKTGIVKDMVDEPDEREIPAEYTVNTETGEVNVNE